MSKLSNVILKRYVCIMKKTKKINIKKTFNLYVIVNELHMKRDWILTMLGTKIGIIYHKKRSL